MAKREAVSTIRGYFYQFDYSILKVLELEHDDDTICIEGVEDVDISNEDNVTFHQCKCYEETEYNHSKIAPAIRWMLKHYSNNKDSTYNYYIYGNFKSGQAKLGEVTVDYAKMHFFTFTKDSKKHVLHTELGLTDDDISAFLTKLKININAEKYKDQIKTVKDCICSSVGCRKQEVDLYYCNALSVIKKLSTDKNTQNRTISRKEFIEKLKTVDQQFEVWLLHKNGIEHFAKTIKKKYFNSVFNVSPYERFFLIECSRSTSLVDLKSVVLKISHKFSKLSQRAKPKFCPYFCFYGIDEEMTLNLKNALSRDGVCFTDGYCFRGADFNAKAIVKEPTNGNLFALKIIDNIDLLNSVYEEIHSTIEIYQFFSSSIYYENTVYKHIKIPFENVMEIENMI